MTVKEDFDDNTINQLNRFLKFKLDDTIETGNHEPFATGNHPDGYSRNCWVARQHGCSGVLQKQKQ
ncbi:hypothetical protein MAR_004854 [Mya arenaria]|uniref:Uncharacterized protein n=1 Tax=Mya arenaria TaxID=6604 RepID=A0ABY7F1W7_MYAAR|nr:hypothetical protein MAR_004854 [Mya arenaria]